MKYTWLAEKYLEGELSGEALQKFELEILRNQEAARELERIRSLQKFMENQHAIMSARGGLIEDFDDLENVIPEYEMAGELEELKIRKVGSSDRNLQDFRTRLAEVEANRVLQSQQNRMALVRKASVWIAAASLTLLIITSSLLLFSGNEVVDYVAVYNEHYRTMQLIDDIGRTSPAEGEQATITEEEGFYYSALEHYANEEYAKAREDFSKVQEPSVNLYYLYYGCSLMEMGQYDEAIEQFKLLEFDLTYGQYEKWYSGLCYLAMKEPEKARSVLKEIKKQKGSFKKESRAILKKI